MTEKRPLTCPCCGLVIRQRRPTRITDAEAARGFRLMQWRGHTRESLLRDHSEALDYGAPGMTDWLRKEGTADDQRQAD